ncbi:unnamed protein product [Owenia fusiformis]|uniref:protein-tyrosine-phosphatase n=1 Tax=Owenia fusiformis TaxID=6347 RepID=A0A8S4MYF4_OWEFU|nr:unnamed protein product [Owenia fusiformis]
MASVESWGADNTTLQHLKNDSNSGPSVDEIEGDPQTELVWAFLCSAFTIFGLLLATLVYCRKRYLSPNNIRKRKLKSIQDKKAKEVKLVESVTGHPVPIGEFVSQYAYKAKKNLVDIEFQALELNQETDHSTGFANLEENQKKNSYPDVLPFDHNRVILQEDTGDDYPTDYINASYIDGYSKPKAYIAAMGPNKDTMGDFWQMVWQENVHCIVMASNLFEHARQQCERYWHGTHGRYGDIEVWLMETVVTSEFTIRMFKVMREGYKDERFVQHYQISSWSEHDCPDESAVLEYRRVIKSYMANVPGPVLVHCSSGGGRTGAFIALDIILERITREKNVSIFDTVLYLRNRRQNMVNNVEQYDFIYKCVCMYVQCGVTVIPASQLPMVVQSMSLKDRQTKLNGFEREYQTLKDVVPKLSVGECAGGHRHENRKKSREIMLQPPERARPYLMTHDSATSTDYINAVYVDGFKYKNAYIATQWPLKNTQADLWRLIYDYNVHAVVVLNEPTSPDIINKFKFWEDYEKFWPTKDDKDALYGPLTVFMEHETDYSNITTRDFRIRKPKKYVNVMSDLSEAGEADPATKLMLADMALIRMDNKPKSRSAEGEKHCRMFHLHCWPNGHKIPTSNLAMIELFNMVNQWQMDTNESGPILVVSKNGVNRCGVFCALNIACDKLNTEGEIDIFKAVKCVKMNRPQLVDSMMEYIYCYTFMVVLLELLQNSYLQGIIPRILVTEEERHALANSPYIYDNQAYTGQGAELEPHSSTYI